jgi:hypothetical protein
MYENNYPLENRLHPATTYTTETSILKSMRTHFYCLYGEIYSRIKSGGTTVITK